MIKTVKGQFILAIITALLFIVGSFSYIEFTGERMFPQVMFYFAMIFAVYNAGWLTLKLIQSKK